MFLTDEITSFFEQMCRYRACGFACLWYYMHKGIGRKISMGGQRKIAKKTKNNTSSLLQREDKGKKDRKIAKKYRKIALLSLYLLYLYHV